MSPLKDKRVLLGVTGSIAAYKSADLIQRLKEQGAVVKVIQTPSAAKIISPIALSSLTGSKTPTAVFDSEAEQPMEHIEYARWADLFLIAPCTANTLAELSQGLTHSLVSLTYLCCDKPVFIAPAMNPIMFQAPATQENLKRLAARGNTILPALIGEMACGETGEGKFLAPEIIVEYLQVFFGGGSQGFNGFKKLKEKKCLVALGHTQENIDEVRFIANRSSGKTGLAIARALRLAGADVTLVCGKIDEQDPLDFSQIIKVRSTQDFAETLSSQFETTDICIMSAALADFAPKLAHHEKIKDSKLLKNIELQESPHILSALGQHKKAGQVLVGFALENPDSLSAGIEKSAKANCDLMVLNTPGQAVENSGFGHLGIRAAVLRPKQDKAPESLPLLSKYKLAFALLSQLNSLF